MKKVVLAGYTGRENRGTQAIACSTADTFHKLGIKTSIAFRTKKEYNEYISKNVFDTCLMYRKYDRFKPFYYANCIYNKIFGNTDFYHSLFQREILKDARDNAILHIGGDTYCYGESYENSSLVSLASKRKIPIYLWGASIEEDALKNKNINRILKLYDKIYAREALTYELLKNYGFSAQRIFKTADPAFLLEPEKTELDKDWWEKGKVIGINLSPYAKENSDGTLVLRGIIQTVDYILKNTESNIVLVPHVYKEDYTLRDYELLCELKKQFENNCRVKLIKGDYSCGQLKYIISKCEFFIATRTHASIAAYSSCVPTLVLGYSIKSKGIATDLFGTYDGYVLPVQELREPDMITDTFVKMYNSRTAEKEHLENVIPAYRNTALSAFEDIVNEQMMKL